MSQLKILFLDDDLTRHNTIKPLLTKYLVDYVFTSTEAINKLKETKYNVIMLDHDLGGKIFVESGPGTGYEVACWIEQNLPTVDLTIYLHSFNPAGVKRMKMALPDAKIIPFDILIDALKNVN